MKPVALQLYSVREQAKGDFFRTLKEVAQAGYKGVEPAGLHGYEPHEVRRVLDDLGLVVCSEHIKRDLLDDVNQLVETAQALGDNHVITGVGRDEFASADAIKTAAETFQKAAEALKPHGLTLGYHNHYWEMDRVDGKYGLEIFLDAAPDVLAQIDVYWASNFGQVDVPALIGKYASRTLTLHLKDGPLVQKAAHTAVGAGKMDIPACVNAADPDTLKWLIVELDSCDGDMMLAVRDSAKYLHDSGLGETNL